MSENKKASDYVPAPHKNRSSRIILLIVSVLVIILALFTVLYLISPRKAVKNYVKAGISKNGGNKYFSMILPDYVVDQLKSDEKWEDMIESYNADLTEVRDEYKFRIKDIKKTDNLSGDALDGVQLYLTEMAKKYDTEPKKLTLKKGCEFEIEITQKNKKTKKKTTETTHVCAVKIKGEGWKIVEITASELEEISSSNERT